MKNLSILVLALSVCAIHGVSDEDLKKFKMNIQKFGDELKK
jgi:hypothetical protein